MSFEATLFTRDILARLTIRTYDTKTWKAYSDAGNKHGIPELPERGALVRKWTDYLGDEATYTAWTDAVHHGLRSYYEVPK